MDLQLECLSKNLAKYLLKYHVILVCKYRLYKRLFRVLCRQRQSGNDSALHREPRLKGRKRVITLLHSFTRLKTA
jgi:hypothetical protein